MRSLVYITSPSYSGSTLLAFLLNAHPEIACIGEIKGDSMDVHNYRCSCGVPIGDCGFWTELVTRMHARRIGFDLADVWTQAGYRIPGAPFANRVVRHRHRGGLFEAARDLYTLVSPACRLHLRRIHAVNEALVDCVTEMTGCRLFVDSSKDPTRIKYLGASGCFDLRIIVLVRDGRGVVRSTMKHQQVGVEDAAREWVGRVQEIESALKGRSPGSVIRVRYEDLCLKPREVVTQIFGFLEVDFASCVWDFRAVDHHILGNRMRFDDASQIALDTKWMHELSEEELSVFDRVGGLVNRRLGYESGRRATYASGASSSSARR